MKRVYPPPPHLTGKDLDKYYNKKMVIWENNYEYVNLPIACLAGIVYGEYSDYEGRKLPLLIGIVSVIFENAGKALIWAEETDLSLYYLYPTAAVCGLLGDFLLTMSCINAYLADAFPDKIKLSYRMVIVSIIFSFGSFIASRFTKYLVIWTSKIMVLCVVEVVLIVVFLLHWAILDNKKPEKSEESDRDYINHTRSISTTIKLGFLSVYESAKIFLVEREGHIRLFLYLCFAANFLDQFIYGEEKGLLGTYLRLPPFKWGTSQWANYRSWRPIVQMTGMSIGMAVFKRLLHLRDTFIICIAIASMACCVIVIGLAQTSWMIYASLLPGSLHGLLNPMTYTFMACLVSPHEIGKAYAMSSIAQKLAGIMQALILQNIYIATVDWYQGFVWLLMGALSFVACGIYVAVHVVAKKEKVGS